MTSIDESNVEGSKVPNSIVRLSKLNKFFVKQKFTPIQNVYRISAPDESGNGPGEVLLNVKQKRMKIKEEINFFEGEDGSEVAMRLKSRSAFEFANRTEIQLPDGTVLAQLQKNFGKSLLRSQWEVLDASGQNIVAWATESNPTLAIIRRVWDFIPILNTIPFFIPFHFDIMVGDQKVGDYKRLLNSVTDSYVMDLEADTNHAVDRVAAAGLAIALDALTDR